MRRSDREVVEVRELKDILDRCKTCHLAMVDDGHPYVIPLSYAYEIKGDTLILYFHSAKEGRKLDLLRKNNQVCFEMCQEGRLEYSEKNPCHSGYDYSCVHGFGIVEFIDNPEEACEALTHLMRHQTNHAVSFTKEQTEHVCLYRVVSTDFTGKSRR